MRTPNEKSLSSSRLCLRNALAAVLVFSSAGACAQEAASYTAAITPVYQFDSDLDSGGNVGYAQAVRQRCCATRKIRHCANVLRPIGTQKILAQHPAAQNRP